MRILSWEGAAAYFAIMIFWMGFGAFLSDTRKEFKGFLILSVVWPIFMIGIVITFFASFIRYTIEWYRTLPSGKE